ncbi:MAG: succinylglutamate desuccinylase/aspartoacylase family protein [Alphaproteobacteria bacterium]
MATKTSTGTGFATKSRRDPFEIGGVSIAAGTSAVVDLPISLLFDHTPMTLTVRVVHGRKPGPVLLLAAAVHGDEINGVEIIRRLMRRRGLGSLSGTLVAVPVVNTFGFINQSRYLPDRRDLNRSFPGSAKGSLTSQLAHLFTTEVLAKCTHGIDLHTGAIHRSNFPQIRGNMADSDVRAMAHAFGVPLLLNAKVRDGSLRGTAAGMDVPVIVYEAGEALRYDAMSIRAGYRGVVNVMRHLGMLPPVKKRHENVVPRVAQSIAQSSTWVRAPAGGLVRDTVRLGSHVDEGDRLGIVSDPLGADEVTIRAEFPGIVIGKSNLPIVNQGDGLFNIARVADAESALEAVDIFRDDRESETVGSEE